MVKQAFLPVNPGRGPGQGKLFGNTVGFGSFHLINGDYGLVIHPEGQKPGKDHGDPTGDSFDVEDMDGGHAVWLQMRLDKKALPQKWVARVADVPTWLRQGVVSLKISLRH